MKRIWSVLILMLTLSSVYSQSKSIESEVEAIKPLWKINNDGSVTLKKELKFDNIPFDTINKRIEYFINRFYSSPRSSTYLENAKRGKYQLNGDFDDMKKFHKFFSWIKYVCEHSILIEVSDNKIDIYFTLKKYRRIETTTSSSDNGSFTHTTRSSTILGINNVAKEYPFNENIGDKKEYKKSKRNEMGKLLLRVHEEIEYRLLALESRIEKNTRYNRK